MNKNGRYNPFILDSVHYVMTIEQLHLVSRKIRGCQYIYFEYILLTFQRDENIRLKRNIHSEYIMWILCIIYQNNMGFSNEEWLA